MIDYQINSGDVTFVFDAFGVRLYPLGGWRLGHTERYSPQCMAAIRLAMASG